MLTMTRTNPVDLKAAPRSLLSNVDIFKHVPASALREVEPSLIEKRYRKRETIFLEDDRAGFVWFVKEGHVKEVHHSADGRVIAICMTGQGGMFGVSAFDGGNYGFHGLAETDARILAFPIQLLRTFMGKHQELSQAVLSQMSKLLRHSKDIQIFAQESAEKRLLHTLVEMSEEFGFAIPLTRREIAEMAGTAVETCIRVFGRLEDEGLIASIHGRLTVRDTARLRKRIEET